MPPTLLGITLLVFVIMRLVPGGPMEEDLKKLMGQGEGKATKSREQSGFSLKPDMLIKLAGDYDRDKPNIIHYLEWLGLMPRDISKSAALFEKDSLETEVSLPGTTDSVKVKRSPDGKASIEGLNGVSVAGWKVRIQSPADQWNIWKKWVPGSISMPKDTPYRA
jgi:hypothetical protein